MYSELRRARLLGAPAFGAYIIVVIFVAAIVWLKMRGGISWPNRSAAAAFLLSAAGLWIFWIALSRSPCFAASRLWDAKWFPRHAILIGIALATAWVLVTLPASYRATQSVREVMVFWHDEGIMLDSLYRFIKTPGSVPEYRLLQGWITFLPVALVCKAINALVPVEIGTINIMMRHYFLAVCWGFVFFSYVLAFLLTRSGILGLIVTVVALWRQDIYILLAIDRPDGFQLLFVILSLISLTLYARNRDAFSFFGSLLFAGLAFASKYSGQILLPAIAAAWIWHHWDRRQTMTLGGKIQKMAVDACTFGICAGVIFTLTFFLASPYHLVNFWDFVAQIQYFIPIYSSGNTYNLPDYHPRSSAILWWEVLSGQSLLDFWLLILCGAGLVLCAVAAVLDLRSKEPRLEPEAFILVWFIAYAAFLLWSYGGELIGYRYVFPILLLIPYFALFPIVLALRRTASRTGRAAMLAVVCAAFAVPAWNQALAGFAYLAQFRVTEGARFEIGRYLDRQVPPDQSPSVLMTNLVYIPDRISNITIANVSVTLAMIEEKKFDYVIMTQNMYDVYANKPTSIYTNNYYKGYKVYYNDVVAAYTAFKNRSHPDYRLLKEFDGLVLFKRIRSGECVDRC
jgi:hypothetical protein